MDRYICPACGATFYSLDAFRWHDDDHAWDDEIDALTEAAL